MVKIIFARHGQSQANVDGVLAGRRGNIPLTQTGQNQARSAAALLPKNINLWATSDIPRCLQTTLLLSRAHAQRWGHETPRAVTMPEFGEVDYGDWSGRELADLAKHPEWKRVQESPQDMVFPAGEAQADAWERTLCAVEKVLKQLRTSELTDATAVVVSHGDIIKMAVASALSMPLAQFQRIAVAPGSLTTINYSGDHPVLTNLSVTATGEAGEAHALGGGK